MLLAGGAASAAGSAPVVDRVVAVVNDQIILLSELDQQATPFEERAAHGTNDPVGRALALKQVRQKVLDDMVADKLVESQANDLGVQVSDREVDAEIARIKKENGVTNDADFQRQLAQEGMTLPQLRDYVRKQVQRRKVIEVRVSPRVVISDAEIRAYYEDNYKNDDEVQVRMISKRIPPAASDAELQSVRDKLETWREQVQDGKADFGEIAKTESDQNRAQGGNIGWFHRGDVAPEVEEAAFALQPGQVSPVFELGGAYHILQVVDRRSNPPKPYDQVKDRIQNLLFQRAAEKEYDRWIADLRTRSFVEERLDGPVPAEETPTPAATATPSKK